MEYLLEIKQKENGKDSKVKYKMLSAIREDGVKVFADEVEKTDAFGNTINFKTRYKEHLSFQP